MNISVDLIKQLREQTGAGIADCQSEGQEDGTDKRERVYR